MATIGRWYRARIGLSGNALEKRGERRLRHPSTRAASRRAFDQRTRRCGGAERGSDGSDAASRDPGTRWFRTARTDGRNHRLSRHQSGHGMPCPNTDTLPPTIIAYRIISGGYTSFAAGDDEMPPTLPGSSLAREPGRAGGMSHRGGFFGKPLRAIFRFRHQDALPPPSPACGRGGQGG